MAKMKLVFTGYEEHWDETIVQLTVKATLNDVEIMVSSLPMSYKRATTVVVNRTAQDVFNCVAEEAVKRLGTFPADYDRDTAKMLAEFDVFLHQTFRDQCAEYEIPFNHLLN